MRYLAWIGAVLLGAVAPQYAQAFGLKTHLRIGQQIIEDLKRDCKVEVAGRRESIAPELCRSILDNQSSFLAGVIGPDGFPDLITGQITTHPGMPNDWQTSDWLKHLYADAPTGERLAFAAGYLVHAGSDTFAHSYVNAYAGDIFVLNDERAVELRHFLLEKYIDARLPFGGPDPADLKVPAEFVRDRMIYDDDAARVSGKAGALHIPAMRGVRHSVSELTKSLDNIEAEAGRVLGDVVVEGGELQIKIADGELALSAAEVGLNGAEVSLTAQRQALDLAKGTLDGAIDAVRGNDLLIAQSEAQARAAHAAINAAESAATDAAGRLGQFETTLADIQRQVDSLPPTVLREIVRHIPERVCFRWSILNVCLSWRWVTRTIRETVRVANELYEDAVRERNTAQQRLNDARNTIAQRAIIVAAEGAREATALQAKAQAEAARVGLNAAQAGVQAAYDIEKAKYDVQLVATRESREKVVALRAEIEKIRNRIVDVKAIKEEIARLVAQSNILSFYARNWEKGLDVAGAKYAEAGLEVAQKMAAMESGAFGVYKRWLTCYGSAFTPTPYQFGEFGCNVEAFYQKANDQVRNFVLRNLPEPFRGLYQRYADIRTMVEQDIHNETKKAVIELAKLAAPDASTAAFIAVLADPASANAAKLRDAYAQVGDAGGKALLTFPDVTQQIDADIGLTDGKVVPEKFNAMAYALRLSKLALLDRAGMRRLVWRLGGKPNQVGAAGGSGRWSILSQSLRSIDGNQQWQPYGIPYARSDNRPEPADPQKRRYGWGPADSAGGLSLFVNPELRTTVFSRIFPDPIAGALATRPELSALTFPFASCARNPFPVTFAADGTSVGVDKSCAQPDSERRQTDSFGLQIRRFFRSIIGALGLGPR
jgi:hypothetical protein